MEFHSSVPPVDLAPLTGLTIPQFLLDAPPAVDRLGLRPARDAASAVWFVEDATGRRYDLDAVRQRVYGLANALAGAWGVRDGDVGELPVLRSWCERALVVTLGSLRVFAQSY